MKICWTAGACLALMLGGCATITRGTNDVFEVNTVPDQAQVTTTNGFACVSPCALKMPRRSEFDVTISKVGYETARAHVTNGVAGGGGVAMAGNVVLGGIIGAGVDAGTGAMLDLKPNPLNVTLAPLSNAPAVAGLAAPTNAVIPAPPAAAAPPMEQIPVQASTPAMALTSPAAPSTIAPGVPPTASTAAVPAAALAPSPGTNSLLLPPVPTQTRKLPGHRVAGHGCPGFAPRVLYASNPDKLPKTCERMEAL